MCHSLNLFWKTAVYDIGSVTAYFCGGHKINLRLSFCSSFKSFFEMMEKLWSVLDMFNLLLKPFSSTSNAGTLWWVFARYTTKNSVILPNILVWTFCRNTQFPQSFGWFTQNFTDIVHFHINFHTRKLGEISVFFEVWVRVHF